MSTEPYQKVFSTKVLKTEGAAFSTFLCNHNISFVLRSPKDSVNVALQFFSKGDVFRYYILDLEHRFLEEMRRKEIKENMDSLDMQDNEISQYFENQDEDK